MTLSGKGQVPVTQPRYGGESVFIQQCGTVRLPGDLTLLRRVDLRRVARLEQERIHVRHQELAGRLVANVEAVVIDERSLVAQPLVPATLTDRREDAFAELIAERRLREAGSALAAADACEF